MEKTEHASRPEGQFSSSLEEEILRSLSLLVKNVSEFFAEVPYLSAPSNTTEDSYFPAKWTSSPDNLLNSLTSTFLTYTSLSLLLWTLNRSITKSRVLAVLLEVFLTWAAILLILPLILLLFVPVFLARFGLSIYLRARYGSKIFLCNPFDAVWSFETSGSTSTCIGLYVIEGVAELEKIRRLLYERVMLRTVDGELVYDRFRWALRWIGGFVCWERLDLFELNYHLKLFPGQDGKSWTEGDLFQALQDKQDVRLGQDPNRSPWEILIVPDFLYENGRPGKSYYAIAFRIHHSLMDGVSMGNILHDGISDRPFKFSVDPIQPLKVSKVKVWFAYLVSFIMLPRITLKNLCFFEKNPMHGDTLKGPKEFCWSRPIKLQMLKEMKNEAKSSVFAVLLSSLGGAMRRMYEVKGFKVPNIIHACPPVAILPYPNRKPRNRFSIVLYPLEIGKECMLERLKQIFSASKKLATSPDVISNFYVIYLLGLLPGKMVEFLGPMAHATMTFSNIPGPCESVTVFQGDRLAEIGAWIPIKHSIGIGMALFSYEDRVRVTFIADRASLPDAGDARLLCKEFEAEVTALGQRLGYNELFLS